MAADGAAQGAPAGEEVERRGGAAERALLSGAADLVRDREAAYDSAASAPIVRMGSSTIMNPSSSLIGGAEVRFLPFAHFKSGGQVFTRAVGYHSDGDAVVLREERDESSNPSASDTDAANRKRFNLTTSHRIEQPLNQKKIEAKGLRAFPGVTGPKARHKHRRWRNQFFIDQGEPEQGSAAAGVDRALNHPARMSKETFQQLYTNRAKTDFQFHDSEGEVNGKWAPFVEISEEKQAALLQRYGGNASAGSGDAALGKEHGGSMAQRWGRIGKPLRAELVRVAGNRESFIQPVEERLVSFIKGVDKCRDDCEEVTPLVLKFDDGYHRLLCHGVVTYYCLTSASKTGDDGERYTVIQPPKCPKHPFPLPEAPLLDYITALSEQGAEGRAEGRKKKKKRNKARK